MDTRAAPIRQVPHRWPVPSQVRSGQERGRPDRTAWLKVWGFTVGYVPANHKYVEAVGHVSLRPLPRSTPRSPPTRVNGRKSSAPTPRRYVVPQDALEHRRGGSSAWKSLHRRGPAGRRPHTPTEPGFRARASRARRTGARRSCPTRSSLTAAPPHPHRTATSPCPPAPSAVRALWVRPNQFQGAYGLSPRSSPATTAPARPWRSSTPRVARPPTDPNTYSSRHGLPTRRQLTEGSRPASTSGAGRAAKKGLDPQVGTARSRSISRPSTRWLPELTSSTSAHRTTTRTSTPP